VNRRDRRPLPIHPPRRRRPRRGECGQALLCRPVVRALRCDATITDRVEDPWDTRTWRDRWRSPPTGSANTGTLERLCSAVADRMIGRATADSGDGRRTKPEPPITCQWRMFPWRLWREKPMSCRRDRRLAGISRFSLPPPVGRTATTLKLRQGIWPGQAQWGSGSRARRRGVRLPSQSCRAGEGAPRKRGRSRKHIRVSARRCGSNKSARGKSSARSYVAAVRASQLPGGGALTIHGNPRRARRRYGLEMRC